MLKLDNTKREQQDTCDRKYYWQSVRHLKPDQGSTALRYGTTWHGAMEGLYSHILENGWTRDGKAIECAITSAKESWAEETAKQTYVDDYRTLENCMKSLVSYLTHFNYDEGILKITGVEQVFQIHMKCSQDVDIAFPHIIEQGGFWFTGRLDLEVEMDTLPWHVEHKTTGQAMVMVESRLNRNAQIMGYSYASKRISAEPPEGCLIAIHHLSSYKSRTTGIYGDPKIDFKRVPQIYTDGDIEAWRISLMSTAEEILRNEERQLWPMKHDNCYRYGRCTFAALCEQNVELGKEVLEGFFKDDPWDVTKTVPEKELVVIE